MKGFTGALDEAGIAKADIVGLSGSFVGSAIAALSDVSGVVASSVSGIATAMSTGAEGGLVDAGYTSSEASTSAADITNTATAAAATEQAQLPTTTTTVPGSTDSTTTTTTTPTTTTTSTTMP